MGAALRGSQAYLSSPIARYGEREKPPEGEPRGSPLTRLVHQVMLGDHPSVFRIVSGNPNVELIVTAPLQSLTLEFLDDTLGPLLRGFQRRARMTTEDDVIEFLRVIENTI